MRLRQLSLALVFSLVHCLVRSAIAVVVIYDNGGLPGYAGATSDFDFLRQAADNFRLSASINTITGVHWFGFYSAADTPTAPDDFTLRIYSDVAGLPPVTPESEIHLGAVTRTDTGSDVIGFGFSIYAYSADITPLTRPAGQLNWLSIVNNTAADGDDDWLWLTAGSSVPSIRFGGAYRNQDGDAWIAAPAYDLAFNLTTDGVVGDYNRNGVVDSADYVVWRNTLGQLGPALVADGNVSHEVDAGDFNVWRSHFGQVAGSGAAALQIANDQGIVPEPATSLMAFAGMLIWYLRPIGRDRQP